MNRVVALSLGIALWGITVGAEGQERLTRLSLDEAVNLAARENATLRAKEFERQAVSANEITAGLRPNPTLALGAEQFTPGGPKAGGDVLALTQYTVSVGQTIELGGKRDRRLGSARAATRVTAYELEDVRRQVLYQVKKSFTDGQTARDSLALAEQNLASLDEVERIQRVRAQKGDISELELLRIEVQRFAFERDAADARQALRAAKIALRSVMGGSASPRTSRSSVSSSSASSRRRRSTSIGAPWRIDRTSAPPRPRGQRRRPTSGWPGPTRGPTSLPASSTSALARTIPSASSSACHSGFSTGTRAKSRGRGPMRSGPRRLARPWPSRPWRTWTPRWRPSAPSEAS